jgi:hypothetical protein
MSNFASSTNGRLVLTDDPHRLAILSTSRVGLAAAEELFGASGAVILEASEQRRWFAEVYEADPEAFWWYAFAWWTIEEDIRCEETAGSGGKDLLGKILQPHSRVRQPNPSWSGSPYWMVKSGVQWGPLFGGGDDEVWRWNGERAELIDGYHFNF